MEKISPHLKRSNIPAIIQLATTLRFLATGAFQGVIGRDVELSLGRSTVSTIMWRVINAIEAEICPHWIKLRMSSEEKRKSKLYFFENYEIPGIVGCIDGTHVRMVKPSEDESLFYNRKGTFSMNAMIVSKPTPFSLHNFYYTYTLKIVLYFSDMRLQNENKSRRCLQARFLP